MFTVKHAFDGRETIFEALSEVTYHARESSNCASAKPKITDESYPYVAFAVDGDPLKVLRGGVVFVMNEDGRTVANYALGSKRVSEVVAA